MRTTVEFRTQRALALLPAWARDPHLSSRYCRVWAILRHHPHIPDEPLTPVRSNLRRSSQCRRIWHWLV